MYNSDSNSIMFVGDNWYSKRRRVSQVFSQFMPVSIPVKRLYEWIQKVLECH